MWKKNKTKKPLTSSSDSLCGTVKQLETSTAPFSQHPFKDKETHKKAIEKNWALYKIFLWVHSCHRNYLYIQWILNIKKKIF